MAILSAAQMAMYARSAGFTGQALGMAVAIGLAESGGKTDAVNFAGGNRHDGLMQISSVHRKAHPEWTPTYLQNPLNNYRAAYLLSGGGRNWGPWEAYTNGSWRDHAGTAAKATGVRIEWTESGTAALARQLPDIGNPVDTAVDAASQTAAAARSAAELALGAAKWMANPGNWIRVAEVIVGGALILAGISIATRGSWQPVVSKVKAGAQKVAAVTPAGRAAALGGGQNPLGGAKSGGPPKPPAAKKAPAKKAAKKAASAPAKKAASAPAKKAATPDPREAMRR